MCWSSVCQCSITNGQGLQSLLLKALLPKSAMLRQVSWSHSVCPFILYMASIQRWLVHMKGLDLELRTEHGSSSKNRKMEKLKLWWPCSLGDRLVLSVFCGRIDFWRFKLYCTCKCLLTCWNRVSYSSGWHQTCYISRMTLNSCSCLYLLSARVAGVHHHT